MSTHLNPEGTSGGHGHAVVIGSSLAGLTAARALTVLMDRVTVIERDWVPRGPGRRRGVAQARHPHALMPEVHRGLERLFPGIVRDLTRAGAEHIPMSDGLLLLGPGGWLPRTTSDATMVSASRDLVDSVIRDRVRGDPKVTFLQQHEAVGLRPGRQDTVTGVLVRARDRKKDGGWSEPRLLTADFVIDATGSTSRAPQWLADMGYPAPEETAGEARTSYATAMFAPPVGHVADWKGLLLMAAPGEPHQGMLHTIEGGRWSVSLALGDGAAPPADLNEFIGAAGALRHPLLREVLESATPLGPVYGEAALGTRWRHYEKLRRWPDQFLVVGDALAAVDPAHGQGMAIAVECALTLQHMLASHGTAVGITYRLRRALAHALAPAWRLSTRRLGTERGADADLAARLGQKYTALQCAAAPTDPRAAARLLAMVQTGVFPGAASWPLLLGAAVRGAAAPVQDPASQYPPSRTHGAGARRRRPRTPATYQIGVAAGSRLSQSRGTSANWPSALPTGDGRGR
ncbi:putative epoxidase LasC [Streptomyces sp. YIM 130001]|uniref:FAD-dependent oxidoreductase n=1 Tax=Streptomyces sp. YIM 130001 TaxID=2259644 RepID=UPI000EBEFC8B|nr:hypothetical protein [Streptomyces sp. YIM 130001]RII13479.1 putative epoxidase LasC [Streptomyces sp. YIM 130001]